MKHARQLLVLILLSLLMPVDGTAFWSKSLMKYNFKIHQTITSSSLGQPNYTFDNPNTKYAFSTPAIDVINQSHPMADSYFGTYHAEDHFDSDSFVSSFNKLVHRRQQLMAALSVPNPDMSGTV